MFRTGFLLDTSEKLRAAMFNRSAVVAIYKEGDHERNVGVIVSVNDQFVRISNDWYPRDKYVFYIR